MPTRLLRHRSTPPRTAAPGADALAPPGPLLLMLEGRAPWEFAALLAATPWLARLPGGDGHPVIVYPGLGASDTSTLPLRRLLERLGYQTHPWHQGFNFGPRRGVLHRVVDAAREVVQKAGRPVSLIGWSLGGVYAREVAKELIAPDSSLHPTMRRDQTLPPVLPNGRLPVRCVVTLGSPFAGHPRATNAWRFYEMVSGQRTHDPKLLEQVKQPPPVPTTSIFSRTDGIVAWQCCVNEPGPLVENIEVQASHLGIGMNPLALYAVADRLAQDPARWRPFDVLGSRRWFYRSHHADASADAAAG